MKKTITLELLQQDLRVIKNESAELIAEDIKHFIQSSKVPKEADELSNLTVGFRQWHTDEGVKNLLVINYGAPLAQIMGVIVGAAYDILEYKEVDSVEMHALLVQHIVENLEL